MKPRLAAAIVLLGAFPMAFADTAPTTASPAIDVAELNRDVRPQDDFWSFVNGKWIARTEIPADQARWGSFILLREQSREDVLEIIRDLSARTDLPAGAGTRKVADLYRSFMDEARADELGVTPLRGELAAIAAIKDKAGVAAYFGRLRRLGVSSPIVMFIG